MVDANRAWAIVASRWTVASRMAANTRRSRSAPIADKEISAEKVVPSRRRPDSSRPTPIGRESPA